MRRIVLATASVFIAALYSYTQTPAPETHGRATGILRIEDPSGAGQELLQCHGGESKTAMGGCIWIRGPRRAAVANRGPAVVPGRINEGSLLKAMRHEGRKMPPAGKLPDAVIADFEKWVAMGAPDPARRESGGVERVEHRHREGP